MPFRKKFKYTMQTDDWNKILDQIAKMPCKTAVIDDAGYIMTHIFMSQHRDKRGNASFEMYDDIADSMYMLIKGIKEWEKIAPDKIVYIMLHEDVDDFGNVKLKTIGRLIDNKVCMEGMVTICIRCVSDQGKHYFKVQTDGNDITKTPEELFNEPLIENDLKAVDERIREYWDM